MGLDIDAQRQAVLAQYCASYNIHAGCAEEVFRLMADDEDRSKQIRIYGTVTPADVASAWKAVYAMICRREAAENLARCSHVDPSEPRKVRVLPQMVRGKEDNQRRLEAGTPDPGPSGSPQNQASWKDFYSRGYVADAQKKVRMQIHGYDFTNEHSPTTHAESGFASRAGSKIS